MTPGPHWFADMDTESIPGVWWQPVLAMSVDDLIGLPIWFGTKDECLAWIRKAAAVRTVDES